MEKLKKAIGWLVIILGYLVAALSFLSLLQDTSKWYLQVLNFPRLQALIVLVLCILVYLVIQKRQSWVYLTVIVLAAGINAWFLFPYTPLAPKKLDDATAGGSNNLSILLANVYMKNDNAAGLLSIIEKEQPAIVLAMEVNDRWVQQLDPLNAAYPHTILYPAGNTYGMALYSKLPLSESEILFFNHDSVPSFYTRVALNDSTSLRLLTVHPVAPKASKHPDNVNQPEVALVKAGRKVAGNNLPVIVAGDFNDVGWSPNSKKFEELSGLRDARHGRGLYNTFSAHSWIMRWPLDYVYASQLFSVKEIRRLESFGSDHFPLLVRLKY